MKPLWRSRTFWVNLLVFVGLVIGQVLDMSAALALPPRWEVWLALAAAVINIGLRMITTQPIQLRPRP